MEKNYEKQERYALLKERLKKALANEFWLEASMIEYSIIEDRTSSILFYADVCKDPYGANKKLSNKLASIEHQIGKAHPIISKKVNRDTIEQIRGWKDRRNDFVHRSCTMYNEELARDLALEGSMLVKTLSNDSAKVSRLAKKMREVK